MQFTLNDNHTENPDECVSIEVEILSNDNDRKIERGLSQMTMDSIKIIYDRIKAETELTAMSIRVLNNPFLVVRGTQIDTSNLRFNCQHRRRWNPTLPTTSNADNYTGRIENHVGDWEYNWIVTTIGGYLTNHQSEQLIMRYQQDILPIIQDEENHSLFTMYTAGIWLDKVKQKAQSTIFSMEAALEVVDAIQNGDYDDETN